MRSTAQRTGGTLETDRALRATLVGFGLLTLGIFVLIGAILQPGMVQCAICNGNTCGPGSTTYCPSTGPVLAVVVGALAIGAVLVAVGLSPRSARSIFPARGQSSSVGGVRRSMPAGPFLALFLLFFGGGLGAFGLLLPFPNFGDCHEPCIYPYVLQGIPLAIVCGGAVAIIVGGALLARIVTLRRSEQGRERNKVQLGRGAE